MQLDIRFQRFRLQLQALGLQVAVQCLDFRHCPRHLARHIGEALHLAAQALPPGQRFHGRIEVIVGRLQAAAEPRQAFRDSLHGPAGLDVGSETPEEIALSVIAEIQAHFTGRTGGMLRERTAPLHDWGD